MPYVEELAKSVMMPYGQKIIKGGMFFAYNSYIVDENGYYDRNRKGKKWNVFCFK